MSTMTMKKTICKKEDREKRYEEGPYTDGVRFKLINFKSTIREAEIYGLPDVIGKMLPS